MAKNPTELTALGAVPAAADLFVVVDVSDTTHDPGGTSKKVRYDELAPAASTTVVGVVELLTTAEAITGTDTTRAMTAAALTGKIDTDGTLAGNLDTRIPSQKAVKTYVDANGGGFQQGFMNNGKFSVTVASNGITVALKTLAGTDPSSSDPVRVRIGDTVRTITSALSVSVAQGTTDTFLSGSTNLTGREIDYFVYLGYNTSAAAVVIGFARYGHAKQYSTFNTTAANANYAKISNITGIASTDPFEVVGRFAATVTFSTPNYNWSVPTFTPTNLINHPILYTRRMTWLPAISASASMTYTSLSVTRADYQIVDTIMRVWMTISGTTGGTQSVALYYTIPFPTIMAGGEGGHACQVVNNAVQEVGVARLASTTQWEVYRYTGGNWTLAANTVIQDNGAEIPIA